MEQLKACVSAVKAAFPEVPVHTETVRQAKELPCFFLKESGRELLPEVNGYYRLVRSYEVRYHSGGGYADCMAVAEVLDTCLHKVDGLRGRRGDFEIAEGVLTVVYTYSCRCRLAEPEPAEKMAKLTVKMELGAGL